MELEPGEASFEASKGKKHCMYRVPWCLRGRGNDNDFRPQLVSIGPYHSADPRLRDMQFHKDRMLDCILKRTGKDISEFYDAIKDLEHEARACYEDLPETSFPSEDFMKMLVLDGCFMLEFLVGCYERSHYSELGYVKKDPIFSKLYMCYGILMDMILIENQIPLFILNQIYEVQFGDTHNDKVTDLMFEAFNPFWVIGRVPKSENGEKLILSSSKLEVTGRNMPSSCLEAFWQNLMYDCTTPEPLVAAAYGHLDFAWRRSLSRRGVARQHMETPTAPENKENAENEENEENAENEENEENAEPERKRIGDEPMIIIDLEQHVIRSVMALKEAGVIFKHKNTPFFWDVKFDLKSGVLEVPQIMIAEWSKSMFLNFMAFELCHIEEENQKILSYILFMDSLVNSAADVDELRACGAIVSTDHEILLGTSR
ncbi:hypothetical protein Cgig2_003407 [Carnegiea gigantea]|uniref:Uncharacterized protein n=1 Tax=Carnegiea gigantea TaxID=171969 RepID=A0A9Q1KA51_9CARY|nr:hypothetical protein Cgig2_003407 [Carnegiea gigantea]